MLGFCKSLGLWVWVVAIITLTPFVTAIVLLKLEIYPDNIRGSIIQGLASVPLIFALRGRLVTMLHNMADWVYFGKGDEYKEKTRIYRLFIAISNFKRPQRGKAAVVERSLVSMFDYLGIIFIIFYYITGIYLQNLSNG